MDNEPDPGGIPPFLDLFCWFLSGCWWSGPSATGWREAVRPQIVNKGPRERTDRSTCRTTG